MEEDILKELHDMPNVTEKPNLGKTVTSGFNSVTNDLEEMLRQANFESLRKFIIISSNDDF